MEIIREFIGNKEKAFELIMDAILFDIESANEEKYSLEDVYDGFTYSKKLKNKFGNKDKVEVTVVKIVRPKYYEAHFKSRDGLNILSYEFKEKEDEMFDLIYRENFQSDKAILNLNFKIMSFLFSTSSKKHVKIMLDKLQVLLNQ